MNVDAAALVRRTHELVRSTVIPEEPAPGECLDPSRRSELMTKAKDAGVFAPHVAHDGERPDDLTFAPTLADGVPVMLDSARAVAGIARPR